METFKAFSDLSQNNQKFCTKGYKYVKRSSLLTSIFKRRLLRRQNLLCVSALVHTVFQHTAAEAFVLKSELSLSIVYQQKSSQTMGVVSHKSFLHSASLSLHGGEGVGRIHVLSNVFSIRWRKIEKHSFAT